MAGYNGYSMSNRAVAAYENGLLTLSKIKQTDLDSNNIPVKLAVFKKAVKAGIIKPAEWHHTSEKYNATNFFDLELIAESYDWEEINAKMNNKKTFDDANAEEYIFLKNGEKLQGLWDVEAGLVKVDGKVFEMIKAGFTPYRKVNK